ncbi:MAG: hypothetical protein RMK75_07690 [Aquificaceae bacterium]|nr:hypothetical protein [Aquificaceae bacterium]MDW8424181.1 hypothetical protein [Aquificaceae bacterium]
MFRTIEVCTDLTERKKSVIRDVLASYRKTARKIASEQYKCLCWGKARGLLAGLPATVPEPEVWGKYPC